MKSRNVFIALGVAAALAAGIGVYSHTAFAQGGPGWMMGGYGPGYHMRGWGGGQGPGAGQAPGVGPANCPAFAQDGQGRTPRSQVKRRAKVTVPVITCAAGVAVTAPA